MDLKVDKHDGITILYLEGRLDVVLSMELEGELENVMEGVGDKLIVDMAGLEYLSSSGLRILIGLLKKMRERKGRLVLSRVRPAVWKIFSLTDLTDLFEASDSLEKTILALTSQK
jgi:anti-sigma B factor antagonist